MHISELAELAKRRRRGLVSEAELAETLQSISTSISFPSIIKTFNLIYGPPPPSWTDATVSLSSLDATQPCLEYAKLHLVRWLFAQAEDFERLNARYFPNHPISVLRLGNGRFAIVDGHHRLWQAALLMGPDAPITVRMISSRNQDLLMVFRNEVSRVAEQNGSAELRILPIRDRPNLPPPEDSNGSEIASLWLDDIPWVWFAEQTDLERPCEPPAM